MDLSAGNIRDWGVWVKYESKANVKKKNQNPEITFSKEDVPLNSDKRGNYKNFLNLLA